MYPVNSAVCIWLRFSPEPDAFKPHRPCLSRCRADIAVNHRAQAEAVCQTIRSAGRKSMVIQADVSITTDVDRLAKTVENELEPVGILVNHAGIAKILPPDQVTEEIWNEYLRINLTSVFLGIQQALPGLPTARSGRIINLVRSRPIWRRHRPALGRHQGENLGRTRSYASQFGKEGITANAIAPALNRNDGVAFRFLTQVVGIIAVLTIPCDVDRFAWSCAGKWPSFPRRE
jgi:NAD(P)-dependent dehydrogenase (short-subunit alcohol dehydrogenase family)